MMELERLQKVRDEATTAAYNHEYDLEAFEVNFQQATKELKRLHEILDAADNAYWHAVATSSNTVTNL